MESIEALVVASAPLEAQNDKKATPLHLAAMHGYPASVKALGAAGASPFGVDRGAGGGASSGERA